MVGLTLDFLIGQNTGLFISSETLTGQMSVQGFPVLLNVV